MNGKLISTIWPNNGPRIQYYPNGLIACITNGNKEEGITYSWFDNGQFKSLIENKPSPSERLLTEYWTKTGQLCVVEGTGFAKVIDDQTVEEGNYVDGRKDGKFMTYKLDSNKLLYEETYEKGKFISGFNAELNSKYIELEEKPEFKGGIEQITFFLAKNLQYPPYPRSRGVQGRVTVTFIVESDGAINEVKVLRGVDYDLDEEATRVVKLTKGYWTPGKQKGKPVRVHFSLPIMFKLDR